MPSGRAVVDFSDQVIYPNTSVDDKGEPLTGTNKYVLHFDAGKLRPIGSSADMMSSFPMLWERAGTADPSMISSLRQVQFLAKSRTAGGPPRLRGFNPAPTGAPS